MLEQLHWLPIHKRIQYKISTLPYQALHDTMPQYIQDLLTPYSPSRQLRSSSENLLKIPNVNCKSFGERSFNYQAPVEWNALPSEIRKVDCYESFKRKVKTYLFSR